MKIIYQKIIEYKDGIYLNPPLDLASIQLFETNSQVKLPHQLIELLLCFDGGEIFTSGTIVFGLHEYGDFPSIKNVNSSSFKGKVSIPKSYLIFAKLNFGDFICINLNEPHNVIQWDHEKNELFYEWDSLIHWLEDAIDDFKKFEIEEIV